MRQATANSTATFSLQRVPWLGWGNAMASIAVAKEIFRQRGIGIDQLLPAKETLLPLNEETEKQRATQVDNNFGAVSPGLVENTTDLLFRDLWLRPALAPAIAGSLP